MNINKYAAKNSVNTIEIVSVLREKLQESLSVTKKLYVNLFYSSSAKVHYFFIYKTKKTNSNIFLA